MGVHAKAEMATCVWSVCLLGSTGVKALLVQSRMRVTLCDHRAIGWHRVEGGRGCGRRAVGVRGRGVARASTKQGWGSLVVENFGDFLSCVPLVWLTILQRVGLTLNERAALPSVGTPAHPGVGPPRRDRRSCLYHT